MNLNQMTPTQFIFHHGKQILLIDFSNISSDTDLAHTADEAKKFAALHRPRAGLVGGKGGIIH